MTLSFTCNSKIQSHVDKMSELTNFEANRFIFDDDNRILLNYTELKSKLQSAVM